MVAKRPDNDRDLKIMLGILLMTVVAFLIWAEICQGQEIQEVEVMDFSGGLVNSITNAQMQPNQALILDNYDVSDGLRRRQGIRPYYVDSVSEFLGQAIFPYYGISLEQGLLVVRGDTTRYIDSISAANIASLILCDDDTPNCTTFITDGFYLGRRHESYPYNEAAVIMNKNIVIGGQSMELIFYDGTQTHSARPRMYGQPIAYPLDGQGNITGIVSYRYKYTNVTCEDASLRSWPVYVRAGQVRVEGIKPTYTGESINLFREDKLNDTFRFVAQLAYNDTVYIDNIAPDDLLDDSAIYTVAFPNAINQTTHFDSASPGGIDVDIDAGHLTDTLLGIQIDSLGIDSCSVIGDKGSYWGVWAIVFLDSAGRATYPCPPAIARIGDYSIEPDTDYTASILQIPTPEQYDSAQITKKIIIRAYIDPHWRYLHGYNHVKDHIGKFYVLDTLALTTTTYTDYVNILQLDNLPVYGSYPTVVDYDSVWCAESTWYMPIYRVRITGNTWGMETDICKDDSTITFQPSDFVVHGSRLFGIGHHTEKNNLYFSDFGRPTTWPGTHLINIPSQHGDWFNGLISMGDLLMIFRQNSIVGLSGLSFYQYQIREISNNVGLTAPRSLAGGLDKAYFAHTTGVYRIPGNFDMPLSYTIQNSFDSIGEDMNRAWGGLVGKEYWLSVPAGDSVNDKTYIFSTTPVPHWKTYSFGIIDGATYDYGTDGADYRSSRLIFLMDNDTLYDWNYLDTISRDDTTAIYATYQSKYYFAEGQNESVRREKVFYVDLVGTGSSDSLGLTFYNRRGHDTLATIWHAVDFTVNKRHRFKVNAIVENLSIKIEDHGHGDYTIDGYVIGYMPWDKGRNR